MFYTNNDVNSTRMTHKTGSQYVRVMCYNCKNFILLYVYTATVGIFLHFNNYCSDINTIKI